MHASRLVLLATPILVGSLTGGQAFAQFVRGNLALEHTDARAADGSFIAWREHLVDDEALGGEALRGSDGLTVADLDRDGFADIVSVHESDDVYDGAPEGHVRIAFGTADPDTWHLVTLAEGPEAGAAEDVAVGDMNGDGFIDVLVACELAHLIYFENPGARGGGAAVRRGDWPRLIPSVTTERGSFIRVFTADLDGDGDLEVVAANKGAQDPTRAAQEPKAIAFFAIDGAPLTDSSWIEHVLTEVPWPINSRPVDIDGDGDVDVIGGSVAEGRMIWLENRARRGAAEFAVHAMPIVEAGSDRDRTQVPVVNGFNMDFFDFSGDGRLDIVTFDTARLLGLGAVWLEQPDVPGGEWRLHRIGDYSPDQLVGLVLADIDADGDPDLMTGGYSLGSRAADGQAPADASLGRLAWFENPGPSQVRNSSAHWTRHDFSRRERGMFDKFVARDLDGDGDVDFVTTRGNSGPYDGVLWLEQVRSSESIQSFARAREIDSPEVPLR
jgi:hypothetical protein